MHMKQYLVFGWYDRVYGDGSTDLQGGWKDFRCSFDTLTDAIEYANKESFDHYHIVDTGWSRCDDIEIVIDAV